MTNTPHAEFPLGPFTPYDANPILRPQGDSWESASVYNPAAVVKDDKVVLLYRAHADDIVSHVGLATSEDGIHFERHPEPVLSPDRALRGVRLRGPAGDRDRRHLLPHLHRPGTARTPSSAWPPRPTCSRGASTGRCSRTSTRSCRRATASPAPWSKAGGILAMPIDGRYLMYFGEGSIYYAWSDDLIHWTPCSNDEPIMVPTPAGHVRRVPRRGRPAADHHQQRPDPAAAQRRREERRRHRSLHLRAAALRPEAADRDHGADELPVAGADDL